MIRPETEAPVVSDPSHPGQDSPFLGESEAARLVRKQIERVARVDSTALILGESGVGKELVAREIHARSRRHAGPFVPLNCAAIPETLIESELFGFEAGAFTDARAARRGAFELAHGGTLFLDEVGDLSLAAQPKLLRAMESGAIQRVGSEAARTVDLRIIAATNRDLRRMSQESRFRQELYYRLRILEIRIPPLRERPEDVPLLADRFARAIATSQGRPFTAISESAMDLLRAYPWPGNVRELRSAIERAMAMNSGMVLDVGCFALDHLAGGTGALTELLRHDWPTAKEKFEQAYVRQALARSAGNVRKAAEIAGVSVRALYKILDRLGLKPGSKPH